MQHLEGENVTFIRVTEVHRSRVIRLMAGLDPVQKNRQPTLSDIAIRPLTAKEIVEQSQCQPRVARKVLRQLQDEGLVTHSGERMLSTPRNRVVEKRFTVNSDRFDEIVPLLALSE